MKDSDEFKVLKKVFKNLGNQYFDSSSLLIGPGDDAGLFKAKKELDACRFIAKIESLNLGWLKFKNGMSLFDQNYRKVLEKSNKSTDSGAQ